MPGIDRQSGEVPGLRRFYRYPLLAFRGEGQVFGFGSQEFGPCGIDLFLRNDVPGLQGHCPFVVGPGFFISGSCFDCGIARGQSACRDVEQGFAGVYTDAFGRIPVAEDDDAPDGRKEEYLVVGRVGDFAAAMNDGGEVRGFDGLHFEVGASRLFGGKYDFVLMAGFFGGLSGMRVMAFSGDVAVRVFGAAGANGHTYSK